MNLNNFVVLPNKPKSVKLNVRNLRELRMETAQLSQDNKEMESRLQRLREVMSREKEEREKDGAFRWKSAQTQAGTRDKEKKLNKSSPSKMKIRALKDEPLPVGRVLEPSPPKDGRSRKSRLKGKVCGQCEARTAGLVCAECAEDYCVVCFAKFHQKGALRFHHIIPMQAELHTSISTLDVVNHFQKKIEREEDAWSNPGGDGQEYRATSTILQPISDNQIHNTRVLFVNDVDEDNEDSLLRDNFDEEESSRSFQQALTKWRAGNTHADREHHEHSVQTARPVSMEVMGTQAGERAHLRIEFKDHGLNYMERLILKKHRRTQIESYRLLSTPRSPQDQITDTCIQPVEETRQSCELTAEEMDLHRYCVSLFAISSLTEGEKVNNLFKSCLSITEIDETAGDPLVDASFGVKQRADKKENHVEEALAMPLQAEEDSLCPPKPLDFSLKTQTLVNETILSGPVESFSQSPPSEQLSSVPFRKLQKSVDISTLTCYDLLDTEQYKEHALQDALSPKLLKPQISKYPLKTKSTLKGTTQFWDFCSSTSLTSQSDSPLIATLVHCQSPAFPVSSYPKFNLTSSECYQTRTNSLNPPLPSQSEEKIVCHTKSLDFSQQGFKPANDTMLSQFSQSPPSDKLSSFTSNKFQKSDSSAILNGSAPALIMSHQQGEHTLQKALSPRHSDLHKPQMAKVPSSPQSKSAVDWDSSLSLSLQSHSSSLSSLTAIPVSFMAKQSPISPDDQCTTEYGKVPNQPLSRPVQAAEDKNMLTQFSQSPRLDYNKPQTSRSSLNATSTQILDSSFFPQSHSPSPSTSIQCLSPAFSISPGLKLSPTPSELYHIKAKALTPLSTKSSSQTQSGNTSSQSQPRSELQKSPLSAEQSPSDDEEPYFLPLGLSSSSGKSEILQSSSPLHLSFSDSDMSTDSVGMLPTDEDSSDEDMRRCALQEMEEEEERNTGSYPSSLFPTAHAPFLSPSPMTEEQSGFFTKPSLVSKAISSLAQRPHSISTNYQGLDGFFTLGLDSRSVPLSPATSHVPPEMHIHSANSKAFMSGDSIWRPESSFRHHAEPKLIGIVSNNQPISITSLSVTPVSKMEPSWRLSQSGACTPIILSVSRPMYVSRPISRAALEILEVQSVEQNEITHNKQDEEDLLTITSLEEEFKWMSAEPNLFISSHGHEDNRKWTKND